MKKVRIRKQKRAIYMFSIVSFVALFIVCFGIQYHKEIIVALDFVEELF